MCENETIPNDIINDITILIDRPVMSYSSPGSSRLLGKRENPGDKVEMKSCSAVRAVPKTFHYEARPITHVHIILISS